MKRKKERERKKESEGEGRREEGREEAQYRVPQEETERDI